MKPETTEIGVLDHGYVRYVDHMGSDQRIVEAARVSYNSPSKGEEKDKKLLHRLYKDRHTSPFEMCKITFNIKMPIFVMRQFVRHRMQNLNEVSARYTELPEEFYIPEKWRRQDQNNKQGSVQEQDWDVPWGPEALLAHGLTSNQIMSDNLRISCKKAYELYQEMLKDGVAREMARFVLPVNIYTEIYCCWDLKNLLHFFSLRDDPHAQWEHQEFSRAMKAIATELFPWTMEAYAKYKFEVKEVTQP
jgi:thymidylate synthase (FAD)